MRMVRQVLAVCLAVLMIAPMVNAQSHVINKAALDEAVKVRVSQERADRDAIVALLHRSDVRRIAAKAGLSIDKAAAAVSTLQGRELQQIASQARQVQNDLAGGASTIVISTTTVIIILLIVLLIVALD